ncbi:atos homolog protein A isoform X3 [Latimeria chalumnae]|uniref:atos homolog protein A isoform X3 n=1 Tax=Latimeria chalumnae TaxID=7897 RepID=UPI0003C1B388|nr:PREDICTED: protein FAM214A isoform X3 [Latimeria chalumnae]|eukprot:XP_006009167.1 PREDICTED: protein FAM214A isoform X3 [Latimeria chalumnae]
MVYSGNKGLHREAVAKSRNKKHKALCQTSTGYENYFINPNKINPEVPVMGGKKSKVDAIDEYFEYDAEEFLVSLTLLITEGRTPECSVKGRTEGFHCPPAQSSQPISAKHECSDKLPQCRQARRTRSEVILFWRNNIPIMVEVMLLPECCYSDDGTTIEGCDLNDPAIKQDALLLERWTLQPVPRQSGDRFIEEKTLLLAVRSFVFFSQLSAWLSASHGASPRNILYRVSAADEELQWNFTQTPSEHIFPVPNISHNVALKVSVQSLPRQPRYPVLKCSIHTNLTFYGKRIEDYKQHIPQPCDTNEIKHCSEPETQLYGKQSWIPLSESVLHTRKCPSPESAAPLKPVKLLYSTPTTGSDIRASQPKTRNYNPELTESSKVNHEASVRSLKSLSLVEPHVAGPYCSRLPLRETNPLIGSLLQERQEVIARIAQHLNYCDPPVSHLPGRPFSDNEPTTKVLWNSCEEESLLKKCKELSSNKEGSFLENSCERKDWGCSTDTPSSLISKKKLDSDSKATSKPHAQRRLLLTEFCEKRRPEPDQDSSRTKQDTVQHLQTKCTELKNCTNIRSCKEGTLELVTKLETASAVVQHKDQTCKNSIKCFANENTAPQICTVTSRPAAITEENQNVGYSHLDNCRLPESIKPEMEKQRKDLMMFFDNVSGKAKAYEQTKTDPLIYQHLCKEDCFHKENDRIKYKDKQYNGAASHDENKDPEGSRFSHFILRNSTENNKARPNCENNSNALKSIPQAPLKPSNIWRKQNYRSLDGTATKAFHPCTGLPLLSSPIPQRKTQTGYFDLDTSLLRLKSFPFKSHRPCLHIEDDADDQGKQLLSTSAPPATSLSLLGNFEESVLNYRLEPLGTIAGFKAEVGASGLFCPTHMTLPVEVSFYSVSDDNAPSPYMGVITLESLGKRGYRVPPSGTIQVTLFNPNKTVVKMFVVIYDLREMPANHQTFLRQRTFSVPVKREMNGNANQENILKSEERILRYLIHLRFQSSKSGKIYLHRDIRLLFSRKSMEVDSGAAYELKSYTEAPLNPRFSQRC